MRFKLFTLLLTIVPLIGLARQDDSLKIRAIANEILLNSQAYENLRVLTKQVGPGLPVRHKPIKPKPGDKSSATGGGRPGDLTIMSCSALGARWKRREHGPFLQVKKINHSIFWHWATQWAPGPKAFRLL